MSMKINYIQKNSQKIYLHYIFLFIILNISHVESMNKYAKNDLEELNSKSQNSSKYMISPLYHKNQGTVSQTLHLRQKNQKNSDSLLQKVLNKKKDTILKNEVFRLNSQNIQLTQTMKKTNARLLKAWKNYVNPLEREVQTLMETNKIQKIMYQELIQKNDQLVESNQYMSNEIKILQEEKQQYIELRQNYQKYQQKKQN